MDPVIVMLKIRQGILTAGLVLYLFIYCWLTFLSRSVMDGYAVHVAPLEDLKNAFRTDHGFFSGLRSPRIMKNGEPHSLPAGSVLFGKVFDYVA